MREQDHRGISVRRMIKRREQMEDGHRYLIYYTFEPEGKKTDRGSAGQTQSESDKQDKEQQNV